jgi:hypothetical protein
MGADKATSSRIKRVFIHGIRESINVPAVKGADYVLPPDVVFVGFRFSRVPRVKLAGNFLDLPDANFRRQKRVYPPQHGVRVHTAKSLNAGDLSLGVNARIRSAGTCNLDLVIKELLKSLLERPLDRLQIGLDLPSVKFGTVIRERQLEVAHLFRL